MLINIQFLRFAAALIVVLYHASKHVAYAGAGQGLLFRAGEAAGFAGVDVFFLISGFIMFYTTGNTAGPAASADFLKRRLARIYSGYWPFFAAAALVFAWARPAHFADSALIGSFLLWPLPLDSVLLDVSWTLSYEMYFYLGFAVLVLLGIRSRLRVLGLLVTALTLFNLARHFLWQDFVPERYYYHSFAGLFLTSPFLLEFFAGSVLGAAIPNRPTRLAPWLLLAGIAGFALAGYLNVAVYDGKIEQGFHVVPRVLLFGIPSALILWGAVALEHGGWVAPRRFSLYTGGASYAIYLCHTIFLVATMKLGLNAALKGTPDLLVQAVFLVYSALIVAFSVAWYRLAERPLHRVFKRLLRARKL